MNTGSSLSTPSPRQRSKSSGVKVAQIRSTKARWSSGSYSWPRRFHRSSCSALPFFACSAASANCPRASSARASPKCKGSMRLARAAPVPSSRRIDSKSSSGRRRPKSSASIAKAALHPPGRSGSPPAMLARLLQGVPVPRIPWRVLCRRARSQASPRSPCDSGRALDRSRLHRQGSFRARRELPPTLDRVSEPLRTPCAPQPRRSSSCRQLARFAYVRGEDGSASSALWYQARASPRCPSSWRACAMLPRISALRGSRRSA